MLSTNFSTISHMFSVFEAYVPAVAVTVASALLVGCAVSGICSPCKDKDEIFHKQVF